ncbi:MAG: Hachiman antiphage defense system protein HamA [Candidatus Paceibacterota bacterium]|jgi:hypothetical protein
MIIPGTKKINTEGQVAIPKKDELFCFCIEQLEQASYLSDFLNSLSIYLPKYVFSHDYLKLHDKRINDGLTKISSIEKAREFLQITKSERVFDSGEFGEFLLHLFATEVKGAHKLATKIQARGSTAMTIPGRDNTFAWRDEKGDIYMLVGEAKTMPKSNDGLRIAQQDLNKFWKSGTIEHEINLASVHIRYEMTEENADIYEAYFIDDNEARAHLNYKNLVFVGYSLDAVKEFISGSLNENDFFKKIHDDLQNSFNNQNALITDSPCSSIYCFVPFESIDDARATFAIINNLCI